MDYGTLLVERVLNSVSGMDDKPHQHSLGQLVLVKHGLLYGYTLEHCWLIKSGLAVWVPPNTVHWGQAHTHSRVELSALYITHELCHLLPAKVKLFEASFLISALCERLMDTSMPLTEKRRNNILQILIEEISEIPASNFTLPLPQDPRLKKVTDSLIDNPAQRKSMADWGKQVGATERTLARLFRKDTGLRYTEWNNRLRFGIACQRLAEGVSNEQLAVALGFSSGDSFGHWFRRVAGSCPGRVRKYLHRVKS